MLYGANSTKFLTCWVSLQSSHANFQNIFVSPNIADIFNFLIFCKHKNAYILKTMLDRADCTDFGCHNSIRLETKHFLNTLALTFISFSGRFVFAMQKHYFFFASDPLVIFLFWLFMHCQIYGPLKMVSKLKDLSIYDNIKCCIYGYIISYTPQNK